MFSYLFYPLLATVFIELGILKALGVNSKKILFSSIFINTFTNISLNVYLFCVNDGIIDIIVGEFLVFIIEAICYFALTPKMSLALWYSFICNVGSFLIGLLVQLIFIYI